MAPKGVVKRRVASKALCAFKQRVRELTRRLCGRSMRDVVDYLRIYLLGWKGYFRLSQTPGVWRTLDQWMRHRLRALQLKQWKRGKTMFRELRALGANATVAQRVAAKRIDVNKIESVGHSKGIEVTNNHYEVIGGDMELFVGPTQKGRFTPQNASDLFEGLGGVPYGLGESGSAPQGSGTMQISIEKNKTESIGNNHSQLIQKNKSVNVRDSYYIDVADELIINAGKRILLKCGQSVILLNSDGSIQINGKTLSKNFSDIIRMVSDIIKVN